MHMSIVEAGHHKVAAKIDNLGFWAFELLDVFVGSDSDDLAAGNSDRLERDRDLSWTVAVVPLLVTMRCLGGGPV